jgi:hypothetical protein
MVIDHIQPTNDGFELGSWDTHQLWQMDRKPPNMFAARRLPALDLWKGCVFPKVYSGNLYVYMYVWCMYVCM